MNINSMDVNSNKYIISSLRNIKSTLFSNGSNTLIKFYNPDEEFVTKLTFYNPNQSNQKEEETIKVFTDSIKINNLSKERTCSSRIRCLIGQLLNFLLMAPFC